MPTRSAPKPLGTSPKTRSTLKPRSTSRRRRRAAACQETERCRTCSGHRRGHFHEFAQFYCTNAARPGRPLRCSPVLAKLDHYLRAEKRIGVTKANTSRDRSAQGKRSSFNLSITYGVDRYLNSIVLHGSLHPDSHACPSPPPYLSQVRQPQDSSCRVVRRWPDRRRPMQCVRRTVGGEARNRRPAR